MLTFPLGLLKLSASRFDVALHQNSDHLLPVCQLSVFRSFTVSLKHVEENLFQCFARRVVNFFPQYNHFIVYHRCDCWVFMLRITGAAAAAAEPFRYSSGMVKYSSINVNLMYFCVLSVVLEVTLTYERGLWVRG